MNILIGSFQSHLNGSFQKTHNIFFNKNRIKIFKKLCLLAIKYLIIDNFLLFGFFIIRFY
ncbi:hypothetical protein CRN76_08365 [Chryseobacterium indologenes]|nr:hypothetical protein CEQ15_07400 [Chryseobacterium indologenes]ATN05411.1 hypothetical protein CRN76_08365 [Chryseobacterium indologenes]AYY85829.1 hypothetical protein EGX91_15370 [Chryseobacterium indologenes]